MKIGFQWNGQSISVERFRLSYLKLGRGDFLRILTRNRTVFRDISTRQN